MKSDLLFEAISKTDEKYVAESENMFKAEKRRSVFKNVLKYAATAASVVLICAFAVLIWIIAENNRDPVASTDTTHGTAAVTSPDTDIPATDTEAVTDPATDVTTETPDEDFETKVRALLTDYNSEQSRSFLFDPDNVSPVFNTAAKAAFDESAKTELKNNAAHFLYAVLLEDHAGDLLYYGVKPVEFGFPKSEAEGYTYLLWLESYLEEAKKAAEGLSADCVQTRAYRTYSLLCASGYEFYTPGDTESRIVDIYERALTLYNAVWGGKPIIDGNTVKITKPYPAELQTAVKEYWGDTDRAFYTSETLDEETFRTLCSGLYAPVLTDTLIAPTKYFIIVNGSVCMTAGDDNDDGDSPYYYASTKSYKEIPLGSRTAVYATFERTNGKTVFTDRFSSDSIQSGASLRLGFGTCALTDEFVLKRGDSATDSLIDLIAAGGTFGSYGINSLEPLSAVLMTSSLNRVLDYCIDRYQAESSDERKAAIGMVFYRIAEYEIRELASYEPLPDSLFEYGDGTRISTYDNYRLTELADWLDRYTEAAETVAGGIYEDEFAGYYPYTYRLLHNLGFNGFNGKPKQTEDYARGLIKKLKLLYNAVKYGAGITDETSESYEVQGVPYDGYTGDIASAVMKYYKGVEDLDDYCPVPFLSQRDGLKTVEQWYSYFSDVLPRTDIETFIGGGNRLFMISDSGCIYTEYIMDQLLHPAEIFERTARVIEEKDGYTVIGFKVCRDDPSVETPEFTVNVRKGKDGYYIDGGSFIDVFIKTGISKGGVAEALSDILRAHAVIYNGLYDAGTISYLNNVFEMQIYNSEDEAPRELKEAYPNGVYPVYICSEFLSHNSSDKYVSNDINKRMISDSDVFRFIVNYSLVIPSAVKVTNIPKACENGDYSIYNIEKALKNVSVKGDKMTVSLDFVRTENGKSASKTYTFEFEYIGGNAVLTGGTFVTECLKK